MKTSNNQFQVLLKQTTALYNSEKEVAGIFEALGVNTDEAHLRERILLEVEENKRQCARLEGLLSVLSRTPYKNCLNRNSWDNFAIQFSAILKRIIIRHAAFGYRTAIFVALALGQNEIANFLKCCLSSGSIVIVK